MKQNAFYSDVLQMATERGLSKKDLLHLNSLVEEANSITELVYNILDYKNDPSSIQMKGIFSVLLSFYS